MKHIFVLAIALLSLPTFAHVRTIVCTDLADGTELLRFSSLELKKVHEGADFSLEVSARLDHVGSMKLIDLSQKLEVSAVRKDEILIASITPEGANPVTVTSGTRRGFAEAKLAVSGASSLVNSYERKGESRMDLIISGTVNRKFHCEAQR